MFHGLMDLAARPATWRAYVDKVVEIRGLAVDALEQLSDALVAHFGRTNNRLAVTEVLASEVRENALQRTMAFPRLPRAGIDPWGRVWEGQDQAAAELTDAGAVGGAAGWGRLILQRHRRWLDAAREYRSALTNFLVQCKDPLMLNSAVRQPKERRAEIMALVHAFGPDERNARLSLYDLTEARRHLPEFQSAFRERYGNHSRAEELDRLESRETEVLERLWSLWRAFVTEPRATFQDPQEVLARDETDALRRLRGRLESALRREPAGTARATILSETVPWEDRPALWIGVEVADPFQLIAGIEAVHGAVKSVLGRIASASLEALMTERAWPHVLLVPTVGGRKMLPNVWRFATANLYLGYFGNESITWIPVPLPPSTAAELPTEALDFLARPELERFEVAWGEFYELVAHLADIARVPVEIDEIGERVQNEYTNEIGALSEGRGRALAEAFSALLEAVSSAAQDRETPLLIEVQDALAEIASRCPAPQESEGERIAIEWEEGLRNAAGLIGAVRIALIAHTTGAEAIPRL